MPRRGSFSTKFEFKGVQQIQRLMDGMTLADQKNVLTGALESAAAPIVAEARATAPFRTGALGKSMGFVIRDYRANSGMLVAFVGARKIAYAAEPRESGGVKLRVIRDATPLRDTEEKIAPYKYIHLVHEGFDHVSGVRVEGRPFLKEAFDKHGQKAEWELLAGCAKALEAIWNKNVAKQNQQLFKKAA